MTMFAKGFTTLVLLCAIPVWDLVAQTAPDTYWVRFSDKDETPFSLEQPEAFLSTRAIERRVRQGVGYDEMDLPVDPHYVQLVEGTGAQVLNRSKWFNGVTIRVGDPGVLSAVQGLPFVAEIRSTRSSNDRSIGSRKFDQVRLSEERGGGSGDYGASFLQISMLNGHELHALGAQGQGMLIGILDSGFQGVDSSAAFAAVRDRNGLVLTRDMVEHDGDVFEDHWHGRSVFSCMAGTLDGYLIGTAPAADYVLLRTEDVGSEYPVEEDHWIAGAELADSLGCDVLNTSLGYTVFDDSTMDHTIAELDGQTVRMSIAANIASRKGIIPVFSAGNRGQTEWRYISVPADAIDVLSVGAVGDVENHAPFSSFGPSADGRVKPDVCAMGWGTTILRADADSVMPANGTSFASPIVAGLVACLWQLHPDRTAAQIMDAVRRSASFFADPNDSLGYGVPDLTAAHAWLELTTPLAEEPVVFDRLAPNPFSDHLVVHAGRFVGSQVHVALFDLTGKAVLFTRSRMEVDGLVLSGLQHLPQGGYVVRLVHNGSVVQQRVVKSP